MALSRVDGQAWIVGAGGVLLRSTDRGVSFAQPSTIASATLRAVRVTDGGLGLAAGDGGVLVFTRDGGVHWSELGANLPADLRGLTIPRRTSGMQLFRLLYIRLRSLIQRHHFLVVRAKVIGTRPDQAVVG